MYFKIIQVYFKILQMWFKIFHMYFKNIRMFFKIGQMYLMYLINVQLYLIKNQIKKKEAGTRKSRYFWASTCICYRIFSKFNSFYRNLTILQQFLFK